MNTLLQNSNTMFIFLIQCIVPIINTPICLQAKQTMLYVTIVLLAVALVVLAVISMVLLGIKCKM